MQCALKLPSIIQYTWIPTTVHLSGMFQKLRLKSPADFVAEALLIRISDFWHIKQWNRLNMKHCISQYVYFNYYSPNKYQDCFIFKNLLHDHVSKKIHNTDQNIVIIASMAAPKFSFKISVCLSLKGYGSHTTHLKQLQWLCWGTL